MDIKDIATGGFLKGKRTYVMGAVAVVAAIASYCVGDASLQETLQKVWEAALALGLITLRASANQ